MPAIQRNNFGARRLDRPDAPSLAWSMEGTGEPLVLVHGVGGGADNWDGVAARLNTRFRILRLDLRGHGASGVVRAPLQVADFARDVTDVMDAAGWESAHLAGFSLGGLIAQHLAIESRTRVRRLAIVSAVAGRTEEERARVQERLAVLKSRGITEVAPQNAKRWFTDEFAAAHPEAVAARLRQLLATDAESYLHAYTLFGTGDLAERLGEIRAPTLVVTGENDGGSTPRMARLMHERIAGSRLEILSGLRHSVLIEAPERVAALLQAFLSPA
jgi:3-oxoadipate enol-lactonase